MKILATQPLLFLFLLQAALLLQAETVQPSQFRTISRVPDSVSIETQTEQSPGDFAQKGEAKVSTELKKDALHVLLTAPGVGVRTVRLRWNGSLPADWKYLGDAFERSYGELEWKPLVGLGKAPWYFLSTNGKLTHGYGVKTAPGALCYWTADPAGVTLIADVRCGGQGVQLGERQLEVCVVVCREGQEGETPFAAAQAFCRQMCTNPRMPKEPVYGFNDWYCVYGKSTAENFLKEASWIASICPKGGNRPYAVIDDGWQSGRKTVGPWDRASKEFSDSMTMAQLAGKLRDLGMRPGIWCRPLIADSECPKGWRLSRDPQYLDPTIPEVRAYVRTMMARFHDWGYEFIKHDFSTFDLSGLWGMQMHDGFTRDGWAFADRSKTTAEVILDFNRDIREGAGDSTVILGCNTIGHLTAGIFEMQRTGDDVSGMEWSRTLKMGVNTLAFRAPQHGTFFAIDGDCVGLTSAKNLKSTAAILKIPAKAVPWEKNRQWLQLVAGSGTPFFVSFSRESLDPEQEKTVSAALAQASKPMPLGQPLDWLTSPTPEHWLLDEKKVVFHW